MDVLKAQKALAKANRALVKALGELPPGEVLVIRRRRLEVNQLTYAKQIGVCRRILSRWELDDFDRPVTPLEYPPLQLFERCFLARRRSGKTIELISREVGYSQHWIGLMEHG